MALDDTTAKLLVGAVIALWGALGGAVAYIRHMQTRMETTVTALYDARDAIRLATIAERDRRIELHERRQAERDAKDDRYLESLEEAVKLLRIQADVTTVAIDRAGHSMPPRRRGTGD